MNGHSDFVGMQENGEVEFNDQSQSWEEIEHPFVDEEKERRAGFFEDHENPSQEVMLINYLKSQGSEGGITSTEANIKLSIGRLASRIHNLIHRDGYVIDKKWTTVRNQFGKKARVMKYSYDKNKNGGK